MRIYQNFKIVQGKEEKVVKRMIIKLPQFAFSQYPGSQTTHIPGLEDSKINLKKFRRFQKSLMRNKLADKSNPNFQKFQKSVIVCIDNKRKDLSQQLNHASVQAKMTEEDMLRKELLMTRLEKVKCRMNLNQNQIRREHESIRERILDKESRLNKLKQLNDQIKKLISNVRVVQKQQQRHDFEMQKKLKYSEQYLNMKIKEELELRNKIDELNQLVSKAHNKFQDQISQNKDRAEKALLDILQEIQQNKIFLQKLIEQRNYFYTEAKRMEDRLAQKKTINMEQQTDFKTISYAKFRVEWNDGIVRAKIIEKMLMNEEEVEKLPRVLQSISAGQIYTDWQCNKILPGMTKRMMAMLQKNQLFKESRKQTLIQSKSKSFQYVFNMLFSLNSSYISRLLQEPKIYKGVYGVWIFFQGSWQANIMDDLYADQYFFQGPQLMWNVLIQKSIIKRLGSMTAFIKLQISQIFQMLTGSSNFELINEEMQLQRGLQVLGHWIRLKKLCLMIQSSKQQQKYFQVNEIITSNNKKEINLKSILSLMDGSGKNLFLQSQNIKFKFMRFIFFSFHPQYFFSNKKVHLDFNEEIAVQIIIHRETNAFVWAQCNRIPTYNLLLASLYFERNSSLELIGKTNSRNKGRCLFENVFMRGKYLLLIKFREVKRNHTSKAFRNSMSRQKDFGFLEQDFRFRDVPVFLTFHSQNPIISIKVSKMKIQKELLQGQSYNIVPQTAEKLMDFQLRMLLLKRSSELGVEFEEVVKSEWSKFRSNFNQKMVKEQYIQYDKQKKYQVKQLWKDYLRQTQISLPHR